MIGCCRGDPVNIDLERATAKGIPVFHTPGRNADAVADLTLAFLLMLARHLGPLQDTFRRGGERIAGAGDFLKMYSRFTGVELGGRTVGLVGLGAVGREVADAPPRVQGPRPRLRSVRRRAAAGVTMRALDDLPARVRLRLAACARDAGDAEPRVARAARAHEADRLLREHGARGADRRGRALRDARRGRLAGAALDVLAQEPLQPDNRFLQLPNVLVTPHIGGATVDVTRHQSDIVVEAMERWLDGEQPRWIANPAVLARRR
jgi:autoinducer 2 (AI-2) kinase